MTRWKNGARVEMSDYIKRTAAIEIAQSNLNPLSIIKWIKNLPSADVAPVRHGKWEEVRFHTIPYNRIAKAKKCSSCGKRKDKYVVWNYCPNCGARMDEENKERTE